MTSNYRFAPYWAKVPHGHGFCGAANAVAVDSSDRVYVFNRGPIPVHVFDRDGNHLDAWGAGDFDRPHGIFVSDDGFVWLVDSGGHFVQKRDLTGALLMTIGERGNPAPPWSGAPFNGPTDITVHPVTGEVFVSDGYGNSHIHKFDADGRHVTSWGGPGDRPGQFSNPHGLCLIDGDKLAVVDRENYRLQFFDLEGNFLAQWHWHHPCAIRPGRQSGNLYVAEMGPPAQLQGLINLGDCVSVISPTGELVERIGASQPGFGPENMILPHGLAVDSREDVYVAELATIALQLLGHPIPVGTEPVSLRKFVRATDAGSGR